MACEKGASLLRRSPARQNVLVHIPGSPLPRSILKAVVVWVALTPIVSMAVASDKLTWTGCGITESAIMDQLARAYQEQTGIEIIVTGGGSTKGIRDVAEGKADMGGTCRHSFNSPEERKVRLIPIAWDALSIVTHKDNPLAELSSSQVHAVFSGEIKEWEELGAPVGYGSINVYVRKGRDTGVGYMSRIMIFSDPEMDFPSTFVFPSTGPLERALERDPNGIAITGVSSARKRALKVLGVDGVEPSYATIQSGQYPYVRPLFLTVREDYMEHPMIADFVRWVRSETGQGVVLDADVVPINSISHHTWDRYIDHMNKAKQDMEAFLEIVRKLGEDSR